ncbi:methylenetetrahydrofolate--tRNA-(uracil(54)-C(5))-methyltransferase (FADH(2)-oxidizing) TrmFO [Methylacidiphilum sp. Yel]|uniref:methylenetetrahydrofolate--tRNA-(uracil(54)- C(5))-methyltransferase (FADH(2)-oxidizing) TrmFO n=1 Tax=Methylacidiphilum sp. Yel TaxID=1847730 RepID=UPI001068E788|nr:methylenetetrahydrofolate--tRNA-(uracil(54)-C(5))-methyltransferase (FADH(2)-oxidizing) TrmFO [Methylacidiphilum sp. Yel]TFE70295.1 methylenetetrahydrofolate--tRNA-(uracil(54)-C(5))-methyltransferase (FADH(2)-oxidizing) TrmFO [Methylacidiphilum sp. Yel]
MKYCSAKGIVVIGGGLAGSEAAWQIAKRGIPVFLYEMRPFIPTGAHSGSNLAEIVCSNSFGSNLLSHASGLLLQELRILDSLLISIADSCSVSAGKSLAVDRERFSQAVTQHILKQPNITLIREEVVDLTFDSICILATGPLTSPRLAARLEALTQSNSLYFYDALCPIVDARSIDFSSAFKASRYMDPANSGDYVNCPLTKEQYLELSRQLANAERIKLHDFEKELYFEGCLPIEIMAKRGEDTLRFGPLRPTGLIDPKTNKRPYAVVQLRQDNLAASLYNMVGFQTNLTYKEQDRIFRIIPALKNAEFIRYGQLHRNTFINAPRLLLPTLQFKDNLLLFFAGQLAGFEGYAGNIASGLVAGINASRLLQGKEPVIFPRQTMIGELLWYICHADPLHFQPMKANFGLFDLTEKNLPKDKTARNLFLSQRSLRNIEAFVRTILA